MSKSYVKNAADKNQVKEASNKELWDRKTELEDARFIMQHAPGRRFIWRLLVQCEVFEDIWISSAEIHRRAGWQQKGQIVMKLVKRADPEKFFLMWKENDEQEIDNDN